MSPNAPCEAIRLDGTTCVIIFLGVLGLMPAYNICSLILYTHENICVAFLKARVHGDSDSRLDDYYNETEMRVFNYSFGLSLAYIIFWILICYNYHGGMTQSEQFALGAGFGLAGISISLITLSMKRNAEDFLECLNKDIKSLKSSSR
ncbi:hypothetical protein BHE90_011561 [Fusarium euwallaceae]|uniref:Uncharacterized protein n=1 Tax=Fusarium euwallaceae TaxID=1147111 RepID=A0A430LE56_9HYPO|nr:hypothetical protein BHE90_011561 [Fusarium euwallaceae]